MIVVDACVAVKWFIEEPDSAAAAEILERDREGLFAPTLARIEVANTIIRYMRDDKLSREEAQAACADWEQMIRDGVLVLRSDTDLVEDAIRLAIDIRHTVPDCLYLALAMELNATVITTDQTLYTRGRKVHGAIQQLGKAA